MSTRLCPFLILLPLTFFSLQVDVDTNQVNHSNCFQQSSKAWFKFSLNLDVMSCNGPWNPKMAQTNCLQWENDVEVLHWCKEPNYWEAQKDSKKFQVGFVLAFLLQEIARKELVSAMPTFVLFIKGKFRISWVISHLIGVPLNLLVNNGRECRLKAVAQ